MQEYRLIILDGAGVLHLPHEFEAADDESAIVRAEQLCSQGRKMELWTHDHKVRCWGFPSCPSHRQ